MDLGGMAANGRLDSWFICGGFYSFAFRGRIPGGGAFRNDMRKSQTPTDSNREIFCFFRYKGPCVLVATNVFGFISAFFLPFGCLTR